MGVYNTIIFILFLLVGIFHLLCAILNWDWFFKSIQVKNVVLKIGRNGARILYGLLGLMLILFAISTIVGWL